MLAVGLALSTGAARTLALLLTGRRRSGDEHRLADRGAALDRLMRGRRVGEREALHERHEAPVRGGRQRLLLEVAQAAGALRHARADRGRDGDPAPEEVARRELGRGARGEAEQDEPATGAEQLQGAAADGTAHAVERRRDLAPVERPTHRYAPIWRGVIDGERGPELRHALHLGRTAGDADH